MEIKFLNEDICVPNILGGRGVNNPNNPLIYATYT